MDWLDLLAVQGTLKSLLQHHSSKASILRRSAFFTIQLAHPYLTTGKTIALTRRIFLGKAMSLLLNMLSRLVITFLPRSKHVLISWLQSPSAVIFDPPKINYDTVSTVSPSISHEVILPYPQSGLLPFSIITCPFSPSLELPLQWLVSLSFSCFFKMDFTTYITILNNTLFSFDCFVFVEMKSYSVCILLQLTFSFNTAFEGHSCRYYSSGSLIFISVESTSLFILLLIDWVVSVFCYCKEYCFNILVCVDRYRYNLGVTFLKQICSGPT